MRWILLDCKQHKKGCETREDAMMSVCDRDILYTVLYSIHSTVGYLVRTVNIRSIENAVVVTHRYSSCSATTLKTKLKIRNAIPGTVQNIRAEPLSIDDDSEDVHCIYRGTFYCKGYKHIYLVNHRKS